MIDVLTHSCFFQEYGPSVNGLWAKFFSHLQTQGNSNDIQEKYF